MYYHKMLVISREMPASLLFASAQQLPGNTHQFIGLCLVSNVGLVKQDNSPCPPINFQLHLRII